MDNFAIAFPWSVAVPCAPEKGKSKQLARSGKTLPLMTLITQIGRKQLATSRKGSSQQLVNGN
jgi:hypothetical protein